MAVTRRARRPWGAARLPRWAYVVREKHLRRFRTLARQLTEGRLGPHTTFDGLVNMGEDGNEIWVEAGLSEPEKRFTVVHELVHARRQRAGEDLDDDQLEEQIVELETIARVGRRTLGRMPSGAALSILHDYLTRGGRDNPETPSGLRAVYRRIWTLLAPRLEGPRASSRPRASARASRRA